MEVRMLRMTRCFHKLLGRTLGMFACLAAASNASIAQPQPSREQRPNIIFVLTDDPRWDTLGCMGHPFLKTPNIDRIANEGAKFTNYFVTLPLCSPSRACILSGQYAHKHGIIN